MTGTSVTTAEDRAGRIALAQRLRQLERRKARDSLAVYAGLHIPAEIENDADALERSKWTMAKRYIPAAHHRPHRELFGRRSVTALG